MKIYLSQVYLEPGMSFDFKVQLMKFIANEMHKQIFREIHQLSKKFQHNEFDLVINISCHSAELQVTGPTIHKSYNEVDFYAKIPYAFFSCIKERVIYFLKYVKDVLCVIYDKYKKTTEYVVIAMNKVIQKIESISADDNYLFHEKIRI